MANGSARNTLGSYLRKQRIDRKLTLRDVEKASGVSNPYLSQIETEKITTPSPRILHKIAPVYGIPYETLMEKAGYLHQAKKEKVPLMPIEKDDLTKELDRIALALDTGLGYRPDSVRTAAKLMYRASARIRAYEELGFMTDTQLKDMESRISEMERWRNARESYEQEQSEYK